MFDIQPRKIGERVVLAGLLLPSSDRELFDEDMAEMRLLCQTASAEVIATVVQRRVAPMASTYLGGGKLREIAAMMKSNNAQTLIIDAELAPGQIRNIEKVIQGKVLERSQLILDIFALHARTREAKIQVELAQMYTLYPRLTHAWSHFSKQVGGIGTRGPGETQLEVDRRLVQKKIADLKGRLKKIESSRANQMKGRSGSFNIALIGYTNVGKSSLLNRLCGSKELVEDKLFATLDTKTRKLFLPEVGEVTLSDTVGFLRKLPHSLVASFRSTLQVVSAADVVVVVMDISSKWIMQQYKTVQSVLADLSAQSIPQIIVCNKADTTDDKFLRKQLELHFDDPVFCSAVTSEGIDRLRDQLQQCVKEIMAQRKKQQLIAEATRQAEQWR